MFRKKVQVVRLLGGLGNQMFQYAFGKALEYKGYKVYFDLSWFDEAKKTVVGDTGKNKEGICIREYEINIFPNVKIPLIDRSKILNVKRKIPGFLRRVFKLSKLKSYKSIFEENAFKYYPNFLEEKENSIFEGYFQNEKYFKNIKSKLKRDFILPSVCENDEYNKNLLKKISKYENSVFIHVRREDYVKIGCLLTQNYYKKAVEYMQKNLKNPHFFVFCAEDPDYIKENFDIGCDFELIGEKNKTRRNFYENMRLMMACKHSIIANSTYSWWAAWLSEFDGKIVIAPSPWMNGQDEIVCENWVKMENK